MINQFRRLPLKIVLLSLQTLTSSRQDHLTILRSARSAWPALDNLSKARFRSVLMRSTKTYSSDYGGCRRIGWLKRGLTLFLDVQTKKRSGRKAKVIIIWLELGRGGCKLGRNWFPCYDFQPRVLRSLLLEADRERHSRSQENEGVCVLTPDWAPAWSCF